MSIPLRLGNTTKRINSTAVPDASQWDQYDVVLKQDTSLEAPVFLLQGSIVDFVGYNYAVGAGVVQGFFWIADVVSVARGRVEIHCVRDVLADNKTAIMSTNAFIEYGQNTFDAGDSTYRVSDHRQTISETPTQYTASVDPSGGRIGTVGVYVLQVVNGGDPNDPQHPINAGGGGVRTYLADHTAIRTLVNKVNTTLQGDVSGILNSGASPDQQLAELAGLDLKNSLLQDSAVGAIKSCHWVPVFGTVAQTEWVWLGGWDVGFQLPYIDDNFVITENTSITIPWPVSDWRRNNAQMVLYLPFIGTVPVPIDQCVGVSSLSIRWSFEFFSGDMAYTVKAGNYTVYSGTVNVAVPYAIGTSRVSTSGAISGALQAFGGALQMAGGVIDAGSGAMAMYATGGMFGGGQVVSGLQGIASGAQNAFGGYMQTIEPAITCAGSMGGLAGLGQPLTATLCMMYYPPLDDAGFSALYGHPVMKIATPVAGFCKTRGFSLASADRVGDVSAVNAAMDGGVFIE